MRWSQKGMAVCLILFVVVLGLLAISSIKQNNPISDPRYASEEDVISLSDEPKENGESVTGGAVTKKKSAIDTAAPQKNSADKKKEPKGQSPQTTAVVTAAPYKKSEKNTPKGREKDEKKQTGEKTDPDTRKKTPAGTAVPTAVPVSQTGAGNPSKPTVHFEIQCQAILDKRDLWRDGLEEIVPESGVFYSDTISFYEGETAYDLLKRICQERKIALDCSYTPFYGSYYVCGIGNLYEFDCGSESGWKYSVNGTSPGISASRYTVQNQDKIAFVYHYEL